MPTVVPSWIDKVNYVIDYWQDPCHAPLLVYLQLAGPPAGQAIITWFSFGLADVLRGFLRPSRALGCGHRRPKGAGKPHKGKFWKLTDKGVQIVKSVPGIGDDIGNWIGKHLPGAADFKGRAISDGEHFLWLIDDVSQRALLALLVIDVATDFLYEWATLLNESEYCKRDHADTLYATGPGTPAGTPFICNAGLADQVIWAEGNVSWQVTLGGTGPGRHHAVSAMKVINTSGINATHYQQVLVEDDRGSRYEFSKTETIAPGATGESVIHMVLIGVSSFVVNHCAGGGGVHPISHDVAIWGQSQ